MAGTTINSGYVSTGASLPGDYTLTNTATGTITNTAAAVVGAALSTPDTVVNLGLIAGGTGAGVTLLSGGIVTNQGTGRITGVIGVGITGNTGTVTNQASISASSTGVRLETGGMLDNQVGGTIIAGYRGAVVSGGAGALSNSGFISATASGLVVYGTGGTAANNANASIIAGVDGMYVSAGTATNQGTISAQRHGIFMNGGGNFANLIGGSVSGQQNGVVVSGGGTVANAAGASITGRYIGVDIYGASSTVTNAGTIAATYPTTIATAVRFGAGFNNRLVVDPGAVFTGAVQGGNSIGGAYVTTLEMASGASTGTLSGIGSKYTGFAAIVVNPSAVWALAGTSVLGAGVTLTDKGALTNLGALDASAGSIIDNASLTNSGSISNRVVMNGDAQFSNSIASTLTGGIYGPVTGADRTIVNAGLITSTGNAVINLQSGGTITNTTKGMIIGESGVDVSGTATIVNSGTILTTGTAGSAVILRSTGTVHNAANARIDGQFYGVVFGTGPGTVTNSGIINAGTEIGVALNHGGSVDNTLGGTITGHYDGIKILGTIGTASNAGYVSANNGTGIYLAAGGSITNASGGEVVGASSGVVISDGTLFNSGSIFGSDHGVFLLAGGTVANYSTGRISGYTGIAVTGGVGTIINQGSIIATSTSGPGAVTLAAGYANLVVLDPGAVFSGTVDGGNAVGSSIASTLELGTGASIGTLSGIGSQYIGFAQLTVDAGASWVLNGANTLASGATVTNSGTLALTSATLTEAGTLINNGVILIDPSTLTVDALIGAGSVSIEASGTLSVGGTVAAAESIDFTGVNGLMDLGTPAGFAGTIFGFNSDDAIELSGVTVTANQMLSGNTLQLSLTAGGPIDLRFDPSQDFTGIGFHAHEVGGNAIITQNNVPCFLTGTLISTEAGEVPVEALSLGQLLLTASGATAPIVWIGKREVDARRHPGDCKVMPVRVQANAFGPGLPHRDLFLSPDHAIYLFDVLIPIKYLINGTTIATVEMDVFTYYHLELPRHDVLLAEGLATESFLDTGNRSEFGNGGDVIQLFPDFARPVPDGSGVREAFGYAPLVITGPKLEAARRLSSGPAADHERITPAA